MELIKYSLTDLENRYGSFGGKFRVILNQLPPLAEDGPWVCGGLLRRAFIGQAFDSDVDMFFGYGEQLDATKAWLERMGFVAVNTSQFNIMYVRGDLKIQLIHFEYFDSLEQVLDSFDFTICQFGFDGSNVYTTQNALTDLLGKKLVLNKLTYGVNTVRRLIKYTNQGFTACSGVITEILNQVAEEGEDVIRSDVKYLD